MVAESQLTPPHSLQDMLQRKSVQLRGLLVDLNALFQHQFILNVSLIFFLEIFAEVILIPV